MPAVMPIAVRQRRPAWRAGSSLGTGVGTGGPPAVVVLQPGVARGLVLRTHVPAGRLEDKTCHQKKNSSEREPIAATDGPIIPLVETVKDTDN
jgi:hypothetical protein